MSQQPLLPGQYILARSVFIALSNKTPTITVEEEETFSLLSLALNVLVVKHAWMISSFSRSFHPVSPSSPKNGRNRPNAVTVTPKHTDGDFNVS